MMSSTPVGTSTGMETKEQLFDPASKISISKLSCLDEFGIQLFPPLNIWLFYFCSTVTSELLESWRRDLTQQQMTTTSCPGDRFYQW
ncbi:hypothetical protein INR49_022917 [Caranx melampygus]|nr:hypothetical protein INR49_022917 [Caranx melampygus]